MEGLAQEDRHEVLGIINAGYKAGATVPRCEGDRQKRVESYAVYAPMALAAIRSPNTTTEDRCISLVLQRGADRAKLNAEVDPHADLYARIRAGCHRLLLARWRDVMQEYRTVELPAWLNARARELWKPLLTVANLADRDGDLTLTSDLLTFAREHVQERPGITAESEALLGVLVERLAGEESVIVRPGELRESVRTRLGWRDAPSAEAVSGWLRRLRMRRLSKDRDGARYEVTRDQVSEVTVRYGEELTVTPSPSPPKPAIF